MASFDAKTFTELDGSDTSLGVQYDGNTLTELDGSDTSIGVQFDGSAFTELGGSDGTIPDAVGGATVTGYYLMQGIDTACGPLTYHYWIVTGSPDPTGAQAGALPCGGPLVDIDVSAEWSA